MNTIDSYKTYWWLAPKYFKELSSRPKYLDATESSIVLIITITAFCGNSVVCLTLVRNPRLRTATNLLILTLAATDMLTACLPLTVATIVLIKGKWIVEVNPLDVENFPCQFQGVVSPAFTSVSLHIMGVTSINRYLCVANWNLYKNVFTKRRTRLMIITDYVLVMTLVSISYPAGFTRVTLDPRRAMCFTTFKQPKSAQTIASIFIATNIGLPMVVIIFCNCRVYMVIRNNSFRVSAQFSHTPGARHPNSTTSRIKEVKLTKTLFSVFIGFLVCWIPVVVCDYLSFNMLNLRFPRQGELLFTYFYIWSPEFGLLFDQS